MWGIRKTLLVGVTLALLAGRAHADTLAYGITNTFSDSVFGVLDLNTGVFTERGHTGLPISALGVGPGGVLYGSGYPYNNPNLYSINPANGALTLVSKSFSPGFYDLGSTTAGLFAEGDSNQSLYSLNPNNGTATLIGPTLLGNFMSTGSSTLYVTNSNSIYSINTTTGAATLVGVPNVDYIAVVEEAATLYAVSEDFRIYTLNPSDGAPTFVANVTGAKSFLWGIAPDLTDSSPPVSATPLPPAWTLMSIGLALLGWVARRRSRAIPRVAA
jgi:hypothetical protein